MGGDAADAGVEVVLVDGVAEARAETLDRRQACQSNKCVQRPRPVFPSTWSVLGHGRINNVQRCFYSGSIQGPATLQETRL